MTLRKFTFEGGTNGANIATTGAATGDTNWGLVNKGTGSTAVYSSTSPMHGSLCGLLTPGSGAACELRWNDWTTATSLTASWYVNWSSAPADNEEFFRVAYGSGSRVLSGILAASSKISLQNAAATIFWTSTAGLSSATWYRFEAYAKYGASTTTGEAEFAYYLGDSATPVQAMTRVTNQNMGTAAITGLYIGKTAGAGTSTAPFSLDSVQANDNGTTFIGPYTVTNAAPVVTAGGTQTVVSGTSVTFAFSATDNVSVTSLTGAVTGPATPTLTGTATGTGTASASYAPTATFTTPGQYTVTATASDGTLTGTAATTVYVYATSGTSADPVSIGTTVWTTTGAGSALAAITGTAAPSTKYVETPAGPTGQTLPITLAPQGAGALNIYVEGYYNAGALTRTLTLYKADGTTQIDTISYATPSADTEYNWAVSTTQMNSFAPATTDRQALTLTIADA
jgi:hypothetical protein